MKTLTREDLKKLNEEEQEDFVLINVLPKEHFLKKHIRTSINLPVESEDFVENVETVSADKDRKVVVYCANAECDASPKAASKLEKAGFSQIYDYEGGTEDWFKQAA